VGTRGSPIRLHGVVLKHRGNFIVCSVQCEVDRVPDLGTVAVLIPVRE
jgi:hypothetical protein